MPRLFVGVELEPAVQAAVAAAADGLRAELGRGDIRITARWVPRDNLHVTLFFIGNTTDDRARAVQVALAPPFAVSRFDIRVAGLGAFPPSGVPRVFWIGLRSGVAEMAALNAEVSARLALLGCEPEGRPYSAHVTIARVKDLQSRGHASRIRRILGGLEADAGVSRVSAVTLFLSRLSPNGSAYEPLLRVPLT
jgi:2'-5' RNA ligase